MKGSITSPPIVTIRETSSWSDEMSSADSLEISDILNVRAGTRDGIVEWYPSEKRFLSAINPGQINYSISDTGGAICCFDGAVTKFKISKSVKENVHPSGRFSNTFFNWSRASRMILKTPLSDYLYKILARKDYYSLSSVDHNMGGCKSYLTNQIR